MIYMFLVKKFIKLMILYFINKKDMDLDNYIFNIYKLRTMNKDSESKGNTNINDLEFICLRKKLEV